MRARITVREARMLEGARAGPREARERARSTVSEASRRNYRDILDSSDGAFSGTLSLTVRDGGAEKEELDPFVRARVERSNTHAPSRRRTTS
jgi:hypothetical protein